MAGTRRGKDNQVEAQHYMMTAMLTLKGHDFYCIGDFEDCPIMYEETFPHFMLSLVPDEDSSSTYYVINVSDESLT